MRNKLLLIFLTLIISFTNTRLGFAQSINSITPDYLSYGNFINFEIIGDNTNFNGGVSKIEIINTSTGLEIDEFVGNVIFQVENDTLITGTVFPVCLYNSVSSAYKVYSNVDGALIFNVTMHSLYSSKNPVIHNSCFQSNDGVLTIFGNQSPTKERLTFTWLKDGDSYFTETVDTLGFSTLSNLPAGDYEVTINKGICSVIETATVNEPYEKIATFLPATDEAYCFSNLPTLNISTNKAGPFPFVYRVNNDTLVGNMSSGGTVANLDLSSLTIGYNEVEVISVTDLTNCSMKIINSLKSFTLYEEPSLNIYSNSTICIGDTATFNAAFVGDGPFELSLSSPGGDIDFYDLANVNTLNLSPSVTTSYSVNYFKDLSNPGCLGTYTENFVVTVSPIPVANISISGSNPICSGGQTSILFTHTAGSSDIDIVLSNGTNSYNYFNIENGEEKNIFPTEPTDLFITSVIDQTNASCSSGIQGDTISIEMSGAQYATLSAPESYCFGDTIPITLNLHGVGPFDVAYADENNNFNLFNVLDGQSFDYIVLDTNTIFLTDVVDNAMPSCGGTPSASITLYPNAAPNPILYGSVGSCSEDTVRVLADCLGQGPFDISYSYEGNNYQTNAPIAPYFLYAHPTAQSYLTVNSITDLSNGCQSLTEDSMLLDVTNKPRAGGGGFAQICGNDVFDLFDALNPPFDTTGIWKEVSSSGALGGSFVQSNLLTPGTYGFRYLVRGKYGCEDDSSTVVIEVLEAPKIINLDITCNGPLTSYTVAFDILDNGASTLSVNGSASGTLDPNPPHHFKSVAIPSGTKYNFEVSNNLGCVANIDGIRKCDCENQAGRLTQHKFDYCEFDTAKAIIDIEPTVASGDSLLYVLKKDASLDSLSYILSNNEPTFTFSSLLNYEQTYYIATFVIPVAADTLNTDDNCVAVSGAIPIVFHESEKNFLGYLDVNGSVVTNGFAHLFDIAIEKNYQLYKQANIAPESRFIISGIEDGEYIIEVIPNKGIYPKVVPLYYGNTPFWEEAKRIDKNCYTPLANYSIGFQELPSISGIGGISGNVNQVDIAGDFALENARVLLIDPSSNEVVAFMNTQASGNYFFYNIPLGTYRIKVEIAGLPQISTYAIELTASVNSFTNADFDVELGFGIYKRGTTDITEKSNHEVMLFPNPAKNQINIQGLSGSENILTIYNLTGKILQTSVISGKNAQVKLNNLVNGVYIVVIENNEERLNWRLTVMN